ncbi:hypothetical protein [Actinosynnema sp. ALI-1.44]|nr:hypothetical protein [Actinosynnema sp. ALI-1.44]
MIEIGIFAGLAAILFTLVFRWAAKVSSNRPRPARTAVWRKTASLSTGV